MQFPDFRTWDGFIAKFFNQSLKPEEGRREEIYCRIPESLQTERGSWSCQSSCQRSRSFIPVFTIFCTRPPRVTGECPVFCLMGASVAKCQGGAAGTGPLMSFFSQDPTMTLTACSPPLPLVGISQNERALLSSEEVSPTHLLGKLVLSVEEVMSPLSSFDPFLAASLWCLTAAWLEPCLVSNAGFSFLLYPWPFPWDSPNVGT